MDSCIRNLRWVRIISRIGYIFLVLDRNGRGNRYLKVRGVIVFS